MDKQYWENYYEEHSIPVPPSLFAEFVLEHYLEKGVRLIDLGCGNGRDSVFFAHHGVRVCGVDQVEGEIRFLNDTYAHDGLNFLTGDFTHLHIQDMFGCIYSRFTLHSVSEADERRVLDWGVAHLESGGLFCCEIRSMNDPKLQCGERISRNENIVEGHYRRYVDLERFKVRLSERELTVVFAEERIGFAPYGNENPPVIRIVAKK